jgi:ElaB/YqjD/DUF883 family membrane-anchored ribosome-binding protein
MMSTTNDSAGVAGFAKDFLDSADGWVASAKDAARTADEFVRESPWQLLGVAALVGVAAGYLASRRSLNWRL